MRWEENTKHFDMTKSRAERRRLGVHTIRYFLAKMKGGTVTRKKQPVVEGIEDGGGFIFRRGGKFKNCENGKATKGKGSEGVHKHKVR